MWSINICWTIEHSREKVNEALQVNDNWLLFFFENGISGPILHANSSQSACLWQDKELAHERKSTHCFLHCRGLAIKNISWPKQYDWCHSLFIFWHKVLISLQTPNSLWTGPGSQTTLWEACFYLVTTAGLIGVRTATIMRILPCSLSRVLPGCLKLEVLKHFMWIISLKLWRAHEALFYYFHFSKEGISACRGLVGLSSFQQLSKGRAGAQSLSVCSQLTPLRVQCPLTHTVRWFTTLQAEEVRDPVGRQAGRSEDTPHNS